MKLRDEFGPQSSLFQYELHGASWSKDVRRTSFASVYLSLLSSQAEFEGFFLERMS